MYLEFLRFYDSHIPSFRKETSLTLEIVNAGIKRDAFTPKVAVTREHHPAELDSS